MKASTKATIAICNSAMSSINGFTLNRNFNYKTKAAAVQALDRAKRNALEILDCAKPETRCAKIDVSNAKTYIEKEAENIANYLNRKNWN
jgi:hypothetical protein